MAPQEKPYSLKDRVEQATLALLAVIGIVLSVADLVGALDKITWLAQNIQAITLLILGLIAGHLVLERRGVLEATKNSTLEQAATLAKIETSVARHREMLEATDRSIAGLENHLVALDQGFAGAHAYMNAFRKRDHFSEICLLYQLRGYGKLKSEDRLVVDASHVLNVWRDCMAGSSTWWAFTYTHQKFSWDTGWGNAIAMGIQRERITAAGPGNIKRVFIAQGPEERAALHSIMEAQKQIGVDVRWISENALMQNPLVAERTKDIGTLDVSIVDGTWILAIYLDDQRRYTHAEVIREHELVDKAKLVFTEAFEAAKPV